MVAGVEDGVSEAGKPHGPVTESNPCAVRQVAPPVGFDPQQLSSAG